MMVNKANPQGGVNPIYYILKMVCYISQCQEDKKKALHWLIQNIWAFLAQRNIDNIKDAEDLIYLIQVQNELTWRLLSIIIDKLYLLRNISEGYSWCFFRSPYLQSRIKFRNLCQFIWSGIDYDGYILYSKLDWFMIPCSNLNGIGPSLSLNRSMVR